MAVVFLNGKFVQEEEACIPISDRGFLFGDGVFTTIRVENGRVECWQAHLERLKQHCQKLRLYPPIIDKAWIQILLTLNQARKGCWRLKIIVTGGVHSQLGLPPRSSGNLLITLKPYIDSSVYPLRLCIFPQPINRPISGIKSLAYLDRLWIKEYAKERGYHDALVCSFKGQLLETSFSNLFWFDGHTIGMPASDLAYLQGIFLNQIVKKFPFPIKEIKAKLKDIPGHSAVYLCNALTHIQPVVQIESYTFKRQKYWEKQLNNWTSQLIESLC